MRRDTDYNLARRLGARIERWRRTRAANRDSAYLFGRQLIRVLRDDAARRKGTTAQRPVIDP